MKKGGGSEEGGGSDGEGRELWVVREGAGPSSWFVGGGGGRPPPFMVVGTRRVFVMLVYRSRVLTGGGGVTWRVLATNHQWAVNVVVLG